tara:strand:+ start:436 stop:597 length:162 start_codon:yes stop_codon:yes gene_type:complete
MELIQNITAVFVIFSVGTFIGALWMFFAMYSQLKSIQIELDVKTHLLNEKTNI